KNATSTPWVCLYCVGNSEPCVSGIRKITSPGLSHPTDLSFARGGRNILAMGCRTQGELPPMRSSTVRYCIAMCVALTVYVGGPAAEGQSKAGPPTGTFALEVRYGNNTVKYYRVSETFRSRIWSRSEKTGQLYLSTNQTILESAPEGDAVRIDLAVH